MLHYIFLEYLLHTNPHKNVYISKQNNAINIISSDSESTINVTIENHVLEKHFEGAVPPLMIVHRGLYAENDTI